jgi:hypothetical protein
VKSWQVLEEWKGAEWRWKVKNAFVKEASRVECILFVRAFPSKQDILMWIWKHEIFFFQEVFESTRMLDEGQEM